MADSGFEGLDGMQVAKFAEGESFVLMQKIARDRVKATGVSDSGVEETALCKELSTDPAVWVEQFEQVYHLAELVMDRTMESWVGSKMPRGIARPFAKL